MRPATIPRAKWWAMPRRERNGVARDLAGLRWGCIRMSSGDLMVAPWRVQFYIRRLIKRLRSAR